MRLEGKDSVVEHFLMDVDNRLSDLTLVNYKHQLGVLVRLLKDICKVSADNPVPVTELEQVTVLHLRQCVQYLLTTPIKMGKYGRAPQSEDMLLSENTVKGYVRVWKAFFNWCYQEELMEANPVARLKPPRVPKRITPAFAQDQIERALAVCDTSARFGFRNYVILLLLLDTGIRLGEIATLRLGDINMQGCYIRVFGKGRKEREVGIYPEMAKLLWKYIHKYRQADDAETALFMGREGPLTASGVHCVVKRIQKLAGLTDIKFSAHVFRHTFSKMYMKRGGDLFRLSRELGHSSVQVTKIYLEDFGSTDARQDHSARSPLADIEFKKRRKARRKTE